MITHDLIVSGDVNVASTTQSASDLVSPQAGTSTSLDLRIPVFFTILAPSAFMALPAAGLAALATGAVFAAAELMSDRLQKSPTVPEVTATERLPNVQNKVTGTERLPNIQDEAKETTTLLKKAGSRR